MATCSKCGVQNAPTAKFCSRCGQPLPINLIVQTCLQCHTPLRAEARFCPNCGYRSDNVQRPGDGAQGTRLIQPGGGAPALLIQWPGAAPQKQDISGARVCIGRSQDNDIVLDYPPISSHHLQIDISPTGVLVTDLNSKNGTQINGQRIPPNIPRTLNPGDVMRIGDLNGNTIRLTLESGAGESVRTLPLGQLNLSQQTDIVIGRDPGCTLPISHPTVSFRHAMIYKHNNAVLLRDLNSTNGTFVNGTRIKETPLHNGDEIQIGPFKLVFDEQQQNLARSMRMGHRIDAINLGRRVKDGRMILEDVTLSIYPSEFVALVGGSGAGKSTLMSALNGFNQATEGDILLDGEEFYPRLDLYRTQMGYVPQDDIIHKELPVQTALYYAAWLRLPDARKSEINKSIEGALALVEMTEHAQKPVKVLSGGQRKRVSIAVELLAKPALFFLDEPTSGLDPGLEKKMMYDLNRLADEGRTVVLVTHATANIEQCDYVAFMANGRLAFFGPPKEAIKFFNAQDFADIYIKLTQEINPAQNKPVPPELQPYYQAGQTSAKIGALWAEYFKNSPLYQKYVVNRQNNAPAHASRANASARGKRSRDWMLRQTWVLAMRQLSLIRHDFRTLAVLLLLMPMIGLLFMAVSGEKDLAGWKMTPEQIDIELTNKLIKGESGDYLPVAAAETLLTMLGLAMTQGGTFGAAYEIVKERAIFKRERAVNLKVTAYVLSKVFVLSLFALFQVVAVLAILQIKVSLDFPGIILKNGALELFITFFLAVFASILFGLFISAIVPSTDVVLYAILFQLFVQIILSGSLFPLESNIASKLTIAHWTMDALGSTVNIPQLNKDARACKIKETSTASKDDSVKTEVSCEIVDSEEDVRMCSVAKSKSNPNDGWDITTVSCASASANKIGLEYDHSPEHLRVLWVGLFAHALGWGILTIIVQMRRKID